MLKNGAANTRAQSTVLNPKGLARGHTVPDAERTRISMRIYATGLARAKAAEPVAADGTDIILEANELANAEIASPVKANPNV